MERETEKLYEGEPVLRKQAEFMANLANIELSEQEIRDYAYARKSDDCLFGVMSDQEILYICVSPEHKESLLHRYPNINVV